MGGAPLPSPKVMLSTAICREYKTGSILVITFTDKFIFFTEVGKHLRLIYHSWWKINRINFVLLSRNVLNGFINANWADIFINSNLNWLIRKIKKIKDNQRDRYFCIQMYMPTRVWFWRGRMKETGVPSNKNAKHDPSVWWSGIQKWVRNKTRNFIESGYPGS